MTYVYSDDYKGVQMALEYLYREGNRVFGVISTSDTYLVTERRRKAVYDFFMEKGLPSVHGESPLCRFAGCI